MNGIAEYLTIPLAYGQALGGLRWSADGDAVESLAPDDESVGTFVVTPALVRLIEGFPAGCELPGIGFLLHFLHLLGASMTRVRPLPAASARLDEAFRATGRIMRNAGSLCAEFCAGVPPAACAADPADVVTSLSRPRWKLSIARGSSLADELAETPPLSPDEFESQVLRRLATLTDAELRHWLRHGRAPVREAGSSIARLTPPRLLARLSELAGRPRLAGAAPLVEHLSGALSLPPRHLARSELPSGGYCDLSTRGLPEQLLPAQFALDDLEFVRRFAERELLYYHRETPHRPIAEEVVLLVDQGVRTWGDVRLVLAAAALALVRQAARQGRSLFVSTTGLRGRMLDTATCDPEELGKALEASDFSAHPAAELERILESPALAARDVVLLTNPRSLRTPEVVLATKVAPPGTRLFSVSVDSGGHVELAEVRGGTPMSLASCRVEVAAGLPAIALRRILSRGANPWQGDAEPVPCPFRLGALQRFQDHLFVFDDHGEWLLLAGAPGLLHAWKVDGSRAEILPRAWLGGTPLHRAEVVLGVAGGFVVAGKIGKELMLAHYDLGKRTVAVHRLGINGGPERIWWYDRRNHAVVGCNKGSRYVVFAVDLASTGSEACYRRWLPEADVAPRARAAANAAPPEDELRPLLLRVNDTVPENGRIVCLDSVEGMISARREDGRWVSFPLEDDGRRSLRGASIIDVKWHGASLALLVSLSPRKMRRLLIFHEELERAVAGFTVAPGVESFALARSGERYAFRVANRQIAVHEIGHPSPSFVTPLSKSHSRLDVELGESVLVVRTSKFNHLVRWGRGPLRFVVSDQPARRILEDEFGSEPPRLASARLLGNTQVVRDVRFDNKRFVSAVWSGGLGALVDFAGHVVIIDLDGAVVAIFHFYRNQVAAWMPGGARLGTVPLIGGPSTPDAEALLSEALRAAAARGKEVVP
ncbi:MAG: hypothetical protein P4L84_20920 [Isosphaeraceae bacterium]|nr:hypothetical protein [Isosphaeraceae bacterium]